MSEADFKRLRRMPVFGGLHDQTLQLIIDQSFSVEVEAGEYFFHEGDRAKSLFVLRKGVVAVERLWHDQPIVLGRLHEGDCIGEMSLIDMQPRSASVRAEEYCQAMEIPIASLHALYKQELEQYAMIMMNMGREVSRRLRLLEQRLFSLEQAIPELKV